MRICSSSSVGSVSKDGAGPDILRKERICKELEKGEEREREGEEEEEEKRKREEEEGSRFQKYAHSMTRTTAHPPY